MPPEQGPLIIDGVEDNRPRGTGARPAIKRKAVAGPGKKGNGQMKEA